MLPETETDPGALPEFQPGPLVKVELFRGHGISLTDAEKLADGLLCQILRVLVPVSGWHWEAEPPAEPPCNVASLYGGATPGYYAAVAAAGETEDEYKRRRAYSKGFVQLRTDGLFHCWYRPGQGLEAAAEQCGLTNDLNDAKYLVAEAWRQRLAVSVYAGETACKVDL